MKRIFAVVSMVLIRLEGYCSCTCANANDCPNGFACSPLGDTGDPTRPKSLYSLCRFDCPLSDQGVEQCLFTTCLVDEDDQTLNRCTAFCQVNTDCCPGQYTCSDVGGAMVCLPASQ